jgi:hypothetical protein
MYHSIDAANFYLFAGKDAFYENIERIFASIQHNYGHDRGIAAYAATTYIRSTGS